MRYRGNFAAALTLASLAFGCEMGNEHEARELAVLAARASEIIEDIDKRDTAVLLIVGATVRAMPPKRQDVAPPSREAQPALQIIGQLLCDVPEAGAKAGDRVVFRPDHPDWSRRCVVMHTTDGAHFLSALEQGTVEIISTSTPDDDDPRARLQHLLQHPLTRLALVS